MEDLSKLLTGANPTTGTTLKAVGPKALKVVPKLSNSSKPAHISHNLRFIRHCKDSQGESTQQREGNQPDLVGGKVRRLDLSNFKTKQSNRAEEAGRI